MTTRIRDLGNDFARFELHQDLCEHLRALPRGRRGKSWPDASTDLVPKTVPNLAVLLAVHVKTARAHARHLVDACRSPDGPVRPLEADAWLAEPVPEPSEAEAARIAGVLRLSSYLGHGSGLREAAYRALATVPHFDAGLCAACFRPERRYELEVLRCILEGQRHRGCLQEAEREFAAWRTRGLYYPLLVAARCWSDRRLVVRGGAIDQALAHRLDRLAVLMRVKSNAQEPEGHDLDRCLRDMPDLGAMDLPDLWGTARRALEQALPPCLLAPSPKRATWALPPLSLEYDGRRLRFAQTQLAWRAPDPRADPPGLADSVHRLGEACVAPEVAHLMLNPFEAMRALRDPAYRPSGTYVALCADPRAVLAHMNRPNEAARQCLRNGVAVPPPERETRLDGVLLAWTITTPQRVILYTGPVGAGLAEPHALKKVLLPDRSRRPDPSAIHLADDASEAAVRDSLRFYAQNTLAPFTEHLQGRGTAHAHTLEEALAQFVMPPPEHHATIELHESQRWCKDHIDPRCVLESTGQT